MEDTELKCIEASGKSVDEAIFKGLQQMGISIDEVSIEIIQTETKGILGIGAKPAKVRLTQRPPEEYEIPDYMKKSESRYDRGRNDRRSDRDNKRRERDGKRYEKNARRPDDREKEKAPEAVNEPGRETEKPAVKHEKADNENRSKENAANVKAENREKPVRERREETASFEDVRENIENTAEKAPEKPIEYSLEAAEGNPAAEFVKGLIEHMGAEGQVLVAQDEDCLRIRIDSEMMGMLIGHRGETLDAMQYLTGLVINKNRKTEGYTRVTLNTEEYREKREETLKRLARKVASQVRATGRPRALEPMNPYERRVLHSALQNNPDVTTHSEGEEPNRRVVVTPRRKVGYNKGRGNRRNRSGNFKKDNNAAEMPENAEINVENYENPAENAE